MRVVLESCHGLSCMTDSMVLRSGDYSRMPCVALEILIHRRNQMAEPKSVANETETEISRDRLAELLNEDLSREYQAIIAYVVYSQVLSGAQYMDIASQLAIHAKQELDHALIISRQIDYLGKMPAVTPKPVRTSKNPEEMLQYDLDKAKETIPN